jgi:hypothetical protein
MMRFKVISLPSAIKRDGKSLIIWSNGVVEYWKTGKNPLLHYSTIPALPDQIRPISQINDALKTLH